MAKIKNAIIEEKIKENPASVGISMDSEGYFEDLLFKVQEKLQIDNKAKTFKLALTQLALTHEIIDQKEFEFVKQYKL